LPFLGIAHQRPLFIDHQRAIPLRIHQGVIDAGFIRNVVVPAVQALSLQFFLNQPSDFAAHHIGNRIVGKPKGMEGSGDIHALSTCQGNNLIHPDYCLPCNGLVANPGMIIGGIEIEYLDVNRKHLTSKVQRN
jgi:hypothetical protein